MLDRLLALIQGWRRVLVHQQVGGVPVVDLATGIPVVCIKVTTWTLGAQAQQPDRRTALGVKQTQPGALLSWDQMVGE